MNHAAPTDLYRQVAGLSQSTATGPEDESLRFSDTWEELKQQMPRRPERRADRRESIRFGDVLATEELGAALMTYRAQHDIVARPTVRFGASLYENAIRAVSNGGVINPRGTSLNRYF